MKRNLYASHTLAKNHVYEEHAGNHILAEHERRTERAYRNLYDLSRVWKQSLKIDSNTKQSTSRPWEQVGIDLFELKKRVHDHGSLKSNSWEIDCLTSTTSKALVLKLKNHFACYGCPDRLVSDNASHLCYQSFVNSLTIGTEQALLGTGKRTTKSNQQWKQQITSYPKLWVPGQTHLSQFSFTAIHRHKEWNQVLLNV